MLPVMLVPPVQVQFGVHVPAQAQAPAPERLEPPNVVLHRHDPVLERNKVSRLIHLVL